MRLGSQSKPSVFGLFDRGDLIEQSRSHAVTVLCKGNTGLLSDLITVEHGLKAYDLLQLRRQSRLLNRRSFAIKGLLGEAGAKSDRLISLSPLKRRIIEGYACELAHET